MGNRIRRGGSPHQHLSFCSISLCLASISSVALAFSLRLSLSLTACLSGPYRSAMAEFPCWSAFPACAAAERRACPP